MSLATEKEAIYAHADVQQAIPRCACRPIGSDLATSSSNCLCSDNTAQPNLVNNSMQPNDSSKDKISDRTMAPITTPVGTLNYSPGDLPGVSSMSVFGIAMSPLQIAGIAIVALPLVFYLVFLSLASIPFVQRHLIYAHKLNTLWWDDLDRPESWGFAYQQVTPFNITTPDGVNLYSWHILPLSLYNANESAISQESSETREDITNTEAFHMLKTSADPKVVIYFHGNAGHLVNSWRPQMYHGLTDYSDYHVITFDYRGFGKSSGSPRESGLVIDAISVIDWVINIAQVPPENIVLFGHSLGTAVVSAALEYYSEAQTSFAGTVLVAPFTSMPTLLLGYRMAGIIPVLGPLAVIPAAQRLMQSMVAEKWTTIDRLQHVVKSAPPGLRLTLVHALNDADIPCTETDKLFEEILKTLDPTVIDDETLADRMAMLMVETRDGGSVSTLATSTNHVVRRVMFPHGGHNMVMLYAPTMSSIKRFFDRE